MTILGLTGNIACGKSTVARMLEARGAVLLDSDLLVRELYADAAFSGQVQALFAAPILETDGSVNRVLLGAQVWADARALRSLEALVHPAVAELRARKIAEIKAQVPQPPAIVIEAVKLIESGQASGCDIVWCVVCSDAIQRQRLMESRGLNEEAARARLANQPPFERKRELLGDVSLVLIPNNSSLQGLEARVEAEWRKVGLWS